MALSQARFDVAAATLGNTALFAGGVSGPGVASAVVDVLDASTGNWLPTTSLSLTRCGMGRTTDGDKAIFAGGGAAGPTNRVDIYEARQPTSFCSGNGAAAACRPSANATRPRARR